MFPHSNAVHKDVELWQYFYRSTLHFPNVHGVDCHASSARESALPCQRHQESRFTCTTGILYYFNCNIRYDRVVEMSVLKI